MQSLHDTTVMFLNCVLIHIHIGEWRSGCYTPRCRAPALTFRKCHQVLARARPRPHPVLTKGKVADGFALVCPFVGAFTRATAGRGGDWHLLVGNCQAHVPVDDMSTAFGASQLPSRGGRWVCTHTHTHMLNRLHARTHIYIHLYVHICIHAYMHAYTNRLTICRRSLVPRSLLLGGVGETTHTHTRTSIHLVYTKAHTRGYTHMYTCIYAYMCT